MNALALARGNVNEYRVTIYEVPLPHLHYKHTASLLTAPSNMNMSPSEEVNENIEASIAFPLINLTNLTNQQILTVKSQPIAVLFAKRGGTNAICTMQYQLLSSPPILCALKMPTQSSASPQYQIKYMQERKTPVFIR